MEGDAGCNALAAARQRAEHLPPWVRASFFAKELYVPRAFFQVAFRVLPRPRAVGIRAGDIVALPDAQSPTTRLCLWLSREHRPVTLLAPDDFRRMGYALPAMPACTHPSAQRTAVCVVVVQLGDEDQPGRDALVVVGRVSVALQDANATVY